MRHVCHVCFGLNPDLCARADHTRSNGSCADKATQLHQLNNRKADIGIREIFALELALQGSGSNRVPVWHIQCLLTDYGAGYVSGELAD
jgi:hypothetical protein